jgi:ribose 5-phosphate isomerase B
MKIAIACDHGGYNFKAGVIKLLEDMNIEIIDLGTNSNESVDYPDFALKAAKLVVNKEADKAILICGTGVGMSMCANKVKGIRACLGNDLFSAKFSRLHNDANVLCLGGRVLDEEKAVEIVKEWVTTEYKPEERHDRRIKKMMDIENL